MKNFRGITLDGGVECGEKTGKKDAICDPSHLRLPLDHSGESFVVLLHGVLTFTPSGRVGEHVQRELDDFRGEFEGLLQCRHRFRRNRTFVVQQGAGRPIDAVADDECRHGVKKLLKVGGSIFR